MECCRLAVQSGRHVDLIEIHSKVDDTTCLEPKQARFGVAIMPVLIDRILIRLPSGIALEFKRDDRHTVQEDHKVDTFIIRGPDLFHDREDVLPIESIQFLVKGCCRPRVHQIQVPVADLDTALQDFHKTGLRTCRRLIDNINDGLFRVALIDLPQLSHHFRLRLIKELKQHGAVHRKVSVKIRCLADAIAIHRLQVVHDLMLILFFR